MCRKLYGGKLEMAVIPDNVLDILAEPESVKMLGTVNDLGVPNVVIISSLSVLTPEKIAFADVCLGKTKENLKQNGKLTIGVIGYEKKAYQIKCKFVHFDNRTALFESWYEAVYKRMMMMRLKSVAVANVIEVSEAGLDLP
jgi:predicted pyridoxine 5'-phosphate oxidase superfamily flavin-nucleotide-binding protein